MKAYEHHILWYHHHWYLCDTLTKDTISQGTCLEQEPQEEKHPIPYFKNRRYLKSIVLRIGVKT